MSGKLYRNEEAHDRVRSASIVKVAIAAHHLKSPRSSAQYSTIRVMITQSDNTAAYTLFDSVGPQVIRDLSRWDTRAIYSPWWGHTLVTAAGQAKYLSALADGKVLPKQGTRMLLGLMRHAEPEQRWGLAEGVQGKGRSSVPVKNGWYAWEDLGTTSINCLALLPFDGDSERLAVAVTTSYASDRGLGYGRTTCRLIGEALAE